jgi:type 1 glutamine amidotransferase
LQTKDKKDTPFIGLEALADCDVILSNLYRTSAPPDQLEILKKHFRSKPVVGMRKAHHGFQNWLEADMEVFGVKYKGHYFGKDVTTRIVDKHKAHPLLAGFKPFLPGGGLYQHTDVAPDVEVLMVGNPEGKPAMPQVWQRERKEHGGLRAFYTRYDPGDLSKDAGVRDMVTRAIGWAAKRDLETLRKR